MSQVDYNFMGFYDLSIFNTRFMEKFSANPRYNPGAFPSMTTLVDLINNDQNIKDVRWAAYMLATVMWETTYPTMVVVAVKNRRGQPVIKNGAPVTVKHKKWLMTMAPVEEVGHGKGRAYHEPVKLAKLADGGVRVTEQDGDQFSVSVGGAIKAINRGAVMGSPDGAAASRVYDDDAGDENAYYGRGYVQLTWWSNYAKSSVALGRGLDLLINPELVLQPATAYALMSHGMRTGFGFANGHKFASFFGGQNRDYKHARKMVNGMDHAEDIAKLAETFESVLMDSRMWILQAPPLDDAMAGAPGVFR